MTLQRCRSFLYFPVGELIFRFQWFSVESNSVSIYRDIARERESIIQLAGAPKVSVGQPHSEHASVWQEEQPAFYTQRDAQAHTLLFLTPPSTRLCICSLISMHAVTPTAHYRQGRRVPDGRWNVEGVTLPQDPLSKVLLKRGNELICIFLLKHAEWWRNVSCYIIPFSWVCPQACLQALHSSENTCTAPIKIRASDKSFQSLSKGID